MASDINEFITMAYQVFLFITEGMSNSYLPSAAKATFFRNCSVRGSTAAVDVYNIRSRVVVADGVGFFDSDLN